jgi:hypothetical protein
MKVDQRSSTANEKGSTVTGGQARKKSVSLSNDFFVKSHEIWSIQPLAASVWRRLSTKRLELIAYATSAVCSSTTLLARRTELLDRLGPTTACLSVLGESETAEYVDDRAHRVVSTPMYRHDVFALGSLVTSFGRLSH